MKLGLYMATQWRQGADLGPELANLIEQVRVARSSGLASLMVGQHFLSAPLQMFQAMPLLARLAAEAQGMQVGPGLLLLPLLNPVIMRVLWELAGSSHRYLITDTEDLRFLDYGFSRRDIACWGALVELMKPDMPVASTRCFGLIVTGLPARSTTTIHSPVFSSKDALLHGDEGQ